MDQIHKDALRRTRVALVKDLNVDHISDDLLAKDIFTPLMMEYIMSERTRIDKVRRLLDDLVRRGPNAYNSFLEVLKDTRHEFLAEKIIHNEEVVRREKEPHSSIPIQEINPGISNSFQHISSLGSSSTPSESSVSYSRYSKSNSELQSSQPPPTGLIVHEMEATESNEDDILNLDPSQPLNPTSMDIDDDDSRLSPDDLQSGPVSQPVQLSDDNNTQYNLGPLSPLSTFSIYDSFYMKDKCYKMDSDPRGVVLIINNSKFEKDYGEREGTEHDCRKLKELFEGFKFKVFVKENLRASEMIREFREFSKNPWLEKVDCMVLAVLSHGQKDNVICGIDGRGINVLQDIVPAFSPKECPSLAGKPKMYICNACRGGKNGQLFSKSIQRDELQSDGPSSFEENRIQIQETRDILLCFSTFPGYASYRDKDQGTWFIQEFVKVFEEQSHHEHVMDMLTEINKRVSKKKHMEEFDEAALVQMPCPASSLIEKWYLNPPTLPGATGFSH